MSIYVEIFASPGCGKCGKAKAAIRQLVKEIGNKQIQWHEVDVVEELDYAVELGVLATPSIVIDKQLVFTSMPSVGQLRRELRVRLENSV